MRFSGKRARRWISPLVQLQWHRLNIWFRKKSVKNEAALVHLDLEDLPLLLGIWSKAHIKRVWKERLVSQGKRMNVLNYILAVKLFGINNPDKYISRYAHVY